MKVLVTGGSGFIGKNLKESVSDSSEFVFLSRSDLDLKDRPSVTSYLEHTDCNVVVHLAANVGGLFKNQSSQLEMFIDNLDINCNVFLGCIASKSIKRIVFLSSTCIFPDKHNSELNEKLLHDGPPHPSNRGYAYAKRMGSVLADLARTIRPDLKVQVIIPTNLYGKYDNYDPSTSHVIPALIKMCVQVKNGESEFVDVKGTGASFRQFLYARDLCQVIKKTITEDLDYTELIIAPTTEYSIQQVVYKIADFLGIEHSLIRFTNKKEEDGQVRKYAKSEYFRKVFPDFEFTEIETGLKETIKNFENNK